MIVWAFETLIASTVLMLLVLAVRAPVRRAFGPNIAYALWAIPAFRMILPPLPDSWHEGAAAPLAQASETLVYYVVEPLGVPTDAAAAGPSVWPWVLAAWMVGAAAFVLYHVVAHGRFCARIRRLATRSDIVANGNVEVIETDAATGPLAFGIWRKYVAFPRDFADRYDPLERDLALAHELGHHARGDLIANWAALVMLAVHWFNPVAWRAFRAFRADQEMACDALVLAGRARELRAAYGRAIVKSAHGGAVSAACHLHTINDIKGRLRMLTKHEKKSKSRLMAGGGAIAALLVGGLGLTASGTQAAETVRTSVESAVGVDLASIALPAIPAVPAVPQTDPLPPPPPPPVPPAGAADGTRKHVRVIIRDKDGKIQEMTSKDGDIDVDVPEGARVDKQMFVFRGDKNQKPFVWNGKDGPMSPEMRERFAKMRLEMRNMPQVSSRNCTEGEGAGENVINRKDGDKKIVIICTNRIEKMASLAAADAGKAESHAWVIRRSAEGSALDGLRSARRSIEANRDMSDSQRATALSGIDQAIRELETTRKD